MTPEDSSRAKRLALLGRALLAFALLASAALAAVLGFAVYLFAQGYSGGSNPQSVAALAFPLSFLVVIIVGLPVALACALAWAGYFAAVRKSRRPSEPGSH
jgi:hypothetical protein